MKISITASGGIHTRTWFKAGKIDLAPAPVMTSFLGNQDWFNWEGPDIAQWTISGDKVRVVNAAGGEDAIWTTYNFNQPEPIPVTARLKVKGSRPASGTYALRLYDSGTEFDLWAHMPNGDFDETQLTLRGVPVNPMTWVYMRLYVNDAPATFDAWDAEFFSEFDTKAKYGKWVSDPVDVYERLNKPITTTGLKMTRIKFFYGDVSDVDEADSVDHAIEVLSGFDISIIRSYDEMTSTRQREVADAVVLNTNVYGYVALTSSPSLAAIEAKVDASLAAGYKGMFIDEAGYGQGTIGTVTRQLQNQLVDYIKAKGMNLIMNCWPWELLDNKVDATYNPTGDMIHLDGNDYSLIESFYSRSDAKYAGEWGVGIQSVMDDYERGRQLSESTGVKICVLPYAIKGSTPETQYRDMEIAYTLATGFGFDAFSFGWVGDSNMAPYQPDEPTLTLGSRLVTPWKMVSGDTWKAETDGGVLVFKATDYPVTRSSSSYSTTMSISALTKGDVPDLMSDLEKEEVWETKPDGGQWVVAEDANNLPRDRWVRYSIELRDVS